MDQVPYPTNQPILLGALFSAAWEAFIKHWKSIVLLTLMVALPLNLLGSIANTQIANTVENTQDLTNLFNQNFGASLGIAIILLSLAGVLIPLGIVAIFRAEEEGKTLSAQEALQQAISHWGAGLITGIVMAILLIGLVILLVVPAIIFGVYWAFALYVVMHDDLRGMAALKESQRIIKGYWWKVLGNLLVLSFVASFVGSILGAPFRNLSNGIVSGTIMNTIASVASSFALVGGYLLFRSLKAAKPARPNA